MTETPPVPPPSDPWDLLAAQAAAWGVPLDAGRIAAFRRYRELLVEGNARSNLTRITGERDVVIKHFLDSLVALRAGPWPQGARVVDVGAGAGLPGLALAIARPDLRITLIEASAKKTTFLTEAAAALGLSGVEVRHVRAEDLAREPGRREAYDVATARAVADLAVLAELCLPLVRRGGAFIALKGARAAEELAGAGRAIATLGGGEPETLTLSLPEDAGERCIVVIPKIAPTPNRYPRTAGTPQRSKIV